MSINEAILHSFHKKEMDAHSNIMKLSTGNKITSASDDVSGLSIAVNIQSNVSAMNAAKNNASQASNLLQIGDAGCNSISELLTRQKELAISANSGTLTSRERNALNSEFSEITAQIDSVTTGTKFSNTKLLDGSLSGSATLSTKSTQDKLYNITQSNQYIAHNKVANSKVLQSGSSIKVEERIGKSNADGTLKISFGSGGNLAAGDKIIVGKSEFKAIDSSAKASANEFNLGTDYSTTMRNAAKTINSSDVSSSVQITSVDSTNHATTLKFTSNTAGSEGENTDFGALVSSSSTKMSLNSTSDIAGGSTKQTSKLERGLNYGDTLKTVDAIKGVMNIKTQNTAVSDGDTLKIGSKTYEFHSTAASVTSGNIHVNTTGVTTIDGAMTALKTKMAATTGENFELSYNNTTNIATFTAKSGGTTTNATTFETTGMNAGLTSTAPTATLGSTTLSAAAGTAGSLTGTQESVTKQIRSTGTTGTVFSQELQGNITNITAKFTEGSAGTTADQFTANTIKFFGTLEDGTMYESQAINLTGGNKTNTTVDGRGVGGLGDALASNTLIEFKKIGGQDTEVGFSITSGNKQTISGTKSLDAQTNLDQLASTMKADLKSSDLKIGIVAPHTTSQNYSLKSIGQYTGFGSIDNSSDGLSGSVSFSDKIGANHASGTITISSNSIGAGEKLMINGMDFVSGKDFVVGSTLDKTVDDVVKKLNQSTDKNISTATYERLSADTIKVTSKAMGSVGNKITLGADFGLQTASTATVSINGNTTTAKPLMKELGDGVGANIVKGSDVKVTNFSPDLIGDIKNVKIVFTEGSTKTGDGFNSNKLTVFADVNGKTYQSQDIMLSGGNRIHGGTADGSGYNRLGNTLSEGTTILFKDPTDNKKIAFQLTTEKNIISGINKDQFQSSADALANKFNTQLADNKVSVMQTRSISSFNATSTKGTVLEGMSSSDVMLKGSTFDKSGAGGGISAFEVDNTSNTIRASIDGRVYSQKLDISSTLGGLGNRFDSSNKVILGGADTTLMLKSEADGGKHQLTIKLTNTRNIDISTPQGTSQFKGALNKAFGTGESNALSMQIGASVSDKISISIRSVSSSSLYQQEKLDISTTDGAAKATEMLDKAIESVSKERANIGSMQSRCKYIKDNLQIMSNNVAQSADDITSTDSVEEHARLTANKIATQASMAGLIQSNQMQQDKARILQS